MLGLQKANLRLFVMGSSFVLVVLSAWGIIGCNQLARFKKDLYLQKVKITQTRKAPPLIGTQPKQLASAVELKVIPPKVMTSVAVIGSPYLFDSKLRTNSYLFMTCFLFSFFTLYSAMKMPKRELAFVA